MKLILALSGALLLVVCSSLLPQVALNGCRLVWYKEHAARIMGRSQALASRAEPAPCTLCVNGNVSCRGRALIRGRSHPTRFASGTWLAAHSATWLAARSALPPTAVAA